MDRRAQAEQFKEENDLAGKGGVVIFHEGAPDGWERLLRNPDHWRPGCIAVDEAGNEWLAVGGDDQKGAERWEPLTVAEPPAEPPRFGL